MDFGRPDVPPPMPPSMGFGGGSGGGGPVDPYPREVVDAKFEQLRQEIRADNATNIGQLRSEVGQVKHDLGLEIAQVKLDLSNQIAALGKETAKEFGQVHAEVASVKAELKVWAIVIGVGITLLNGAMLAVLNYSLRAVGH